MRRIASGLLAAVCAIGPAPARAELDSTVRPEHVGRCESPFTTPLVLLVGGGGSVSIVSDEYVIADVGNPMERQGENPLPPRSLICHQEAGLVDAVRKDNKFYLAGPREIDELEFARGRTVSRYQLIVPIGIRDRIEAIALTHFGQLEVVVSTRGDLAEPRFLRFDPFERGDERPVSDFTSVAAKSRVTGVAFTAFGMCVYDDAGEILDFDADATGTDVVPKSRIAGPHTGLLPAATGFRGRRPIVAVESDGNFVAAANGDEIEEFHEDDNGDVKPLLTMKSPAGVIYGIANWGGLGSHGARGTVAARTGEPRRVLERTPAAERVVARYRVSAESRLVRADRAVIARVRAPARLVCGIVACAFSLVLPAGGHAAFAQAARDGRCRTVGVPVAMQVDGLEPIVVGESGAIARFGVTDSDTFEDRVEIVCTPVRGVVALAIDLQGRRFVADSRSVHIFDRDSAAEAGRLAPALAPTEQIVAIALSQAGTIELALAIRNGDRPTAIAVFRSYDRGDNIVPARQFFVNGARGAVSAISTDSAGRTYVYDDGGEVSVYSRNAKDSALPLARLLPGAGTRLSAREPRPQAWPWRRALAFDNTGALFAASGRRAISFRNVAEGRSAGFVEFSADRMEECIGLATSDYGYLFVLEIDPRTRKGIVRKILGADGDLPDGPDNSWPLSAYVRVP